MERVPITGREVRGLQHCLAGAINGGACVNAVPCNICQAVLHSLLNTTVKTAVNLTRPFREAGRPKRYETLINSGRKDDKVHSAFRLSLAGTERATNGKEQQNLCCLPKSGGLSLARIGTFVGLSFYSEKLSLTRFNNWVRKLYRTMPDDIKFVPCAREE
jgi:hypothetical protein